jgi:excisionase family DNA binding protein
MESNSLSQIDRAEAREIARLKAKRAHAEQLVVRPADAERMLGCSHFTLYKLLGSGELKSFKLGKARRITVESIKAYIARQLEQFPTKTKPRRASG